MAGRGTSGQSAMSPSSVSPLAGEDMTINNGMVREFLFLSLKNSKRRIRLWLQKS
jgi:hypothetical protein